MFISEEELQRRLGSEKNVKSFSAPSVPPLPPKETPKVVPIKDEAPRETKSLSVEATRVIAASLVKQGVSRKVVCEELNIAPSELAKANKDAVSNTQDRVRELALNKLLISLGLMTDVKLENASIKELATAISSISRVVEKTAPQEVHDNRVQFLVYTPKTKSIDSYEVLDV